MPFSDSLEADILNGLFTDPAWTPPATLYIGLSSTTPADDGSNFTEPSTGAYARVSTAAADWGAASGTAPVVKSNTAVKTFPTATATWLAGVNLTWFGLFAAASGGTPIATGQLTVAKPVMNGDTPSFAAGQLVAKLGKPTDSF
jgi:hypothetical protein